MSINVKNIVANTSLPNFRIREGFFHSANHLFVGVAQNAFGMLRIVNSSTDKEIVLQAFVSHGAVAYADSYEGTTYTAPGTIVENWNRKVGGPVSDIATVYHTPTVDTLGTKRLNELFPGSSTGANQIGGRGSGLATIIPPGEEILVRVQNKASQAAEMSLGFNWFEQDINLKYGETID